MDLNEMAARFDANTARFVARASRADASPEEVARDRVQLNARTFSGNMDAAPTSKGLMLARELEQILQEVVRTPRPENNALDYFAVDSRIREGAESYTIRRIEDTGSAGYFDGNGSNVPAANVFRDEESWKVLPIVSGYQLDMFTEQAASFSGFNLESELRNSVIYSINEFQNRKAWEGDTARQALGVLNQPYVPRTNFGVNVEDASDGEAIAQEILRLSGLTAALTEKVFYPKRLITSERVKVYLQQRELGTFKEKTIAERVLQRSAYLEEVVGAPELAGAGPNGEDVMLFDYGNDMRRGFAHAVAKPITFLPVQEMGFKKFIPAYMQYGGLRTNHPLNALIAFATIGTGVGGVY